MFGHGHAHVRPILMRARMAGVMSRVRRRVWGRPFCKCIGVALANPRRPADSPAGRAPMNQRVAAWWLLR